MKKSPAISVLLPVYNAGPYLDAALESLWAQSFSDFEVIAIEDGSTDNSLEILKVHAARDPRLVLLPQENRGLVAALNTALEAARAPLVARMDADDICLPGRFALQKNFLDTHPEIIAVGGGVEMIGPENESLFCQGYPQTPDEIRAILKTRSCFAHPAMMIRAADLKQAGGYRDAFRHAEDYDLWLRLSRIGDMANLPDILLRYRIHGGNISARHAQAQACAALAARLADEIPVPLPFNAREEQNWTQERLMALGATKADIASCLFGALETQALMQDMLDQPDIAYALRQKAEALHVPFMARRRLLAQIHLAKAKFAAEKGNHADFAEHILIAFGTHPAVVFMILWRKLKP